MAYSVADVAAWANLVLDEGETVIMQRVIDAVVLHLDQTHGIDTVSEDSEGTSDVDLAIIMQSGRLFKRRMTPEGVAGFGESFVYRVSNFDPDVQALLEPYRKWAIA